MSYHQGDDDCLLKTRTEQNPFGAVVLFHYCAHFRYTLGTSSTYQVRENIFWRQFRLTVKQRSNAALLIGLLFFGEGKALFGARDHHYCIYNQPRWTLCIMGIY